MTNLCPKIGGKTVTKEYRQMVGEIIRYHRIMLGMTQGQLGQACGYPEGIATQTVGYWEAGQRSPHIDDVRPLLRTLHIRLDDLLPEKTAHL